MDDDRRQGLLVPVLVFTATVVAVISSLGAPLLPSISEQHHVPLSTAQWALTVTLLVGTVSSPIMGRLGDGRWRRETMVVSLGAVTLGGVVAAVAPDFAVLIIGRGLQGVGLGLVPLTMAAARDYLPRERANATIAILSVAVAAGAGVGYPVSGLIADAFGLSAAFWFGALVSAVALGCVAVVMPSTADRPSSSLDPIGVLLITIGIVALLLAIADGNSWGWTSARVWALLAVAVVALGVWVVQQLRTRTPLVDLRLLRRPAVLTGDGCAIVLGIAMYMFVPTVTEFIQAPEAARYGFSVSVIVAGLCLVPLSIMSFVASRALPWLTARLGTRALLPVGSLVVALSGVFLAVFHTSLWQAFVMMGLLGVGVGMTSAAIPGLIIAAVPEAETGSAMGFYQVVRYLGFSLGSAVAAAILAANTASGQRLPAERGYTLAWWVAAAICVAAAALAWILPGRHVVLTPSQAELLEEDAVLGPTGFVGAEPE